MSINKKKLTADIKQNVIEIRAVKAIFRESGQPRVTWIQRDFLRRLKKKITILCSIQAHFRGKIHVKGSDVDKQAALIAGCYEEYKLQEQQVA